MPSFYEDVEVVFPGLWAEFCSQVEGDVTQWVSKLSGTAPCLDRDWRKIVFKLFDYLLTTRTSVDCSYRSSGHRLDVIVHPVSAFIYLQKQLLTNAYSSRYIIASYSLKLRLMLRRTITSALQARGPGQRMPCVMHSFRKSSWWQKFALI